MCEKVCPVDAINIVSQVAAEKKNHTPVLNERFCLGCGVCALKCSKGAVKLFKRQQRVLYPEDTFERICLMALERGTLQNQLFPEPDKVSHQIMRSIVGAFLNLPSTKRVLMSKTFRSRFLDALRGGARKSKLEGVDI